MNPKDYSNYGLAQELLRLRTHAPELMAEAANRLAALSQTMQPQAEPAAGEQAGAVAGEIEQLREQRDALMRALEVIAVGDSSDPVRDAGDELVGLGYWSKEGLARHRALAAPGAAIAAREQEASFPGDLCLRCYGSGKDPAPKVAAADKLHELQEAHRLGFLRAAGWVQRDDLFADVSSPAYRKDRDHDLAQIKTAQTTALNGGNGERK